MIVIINGPCGIGKSTVAWKLNSRFARSVMLDGDHIGAVHPFEIYDDNRIVYLYRTMQHLIRFHVEEGGYQNFVINYVFETPESLAVLCNHLAGLAGEVRTFRLVATDDAIEARVRAREDAPDREGELAWYLSRYKELVAIQTAAARLGDMGEVIDTTGIMPAEVADRIWNQL
jgi:predicted kinase